MISCCPDIKSRSLIQFVRSATWASSIVLPSVFSLPSFICVTLIILCLAHHVLSYLREFAHVPKQCTFVERPLTELFLALPTVLSQVNS